LANTFEKYAPPMVTTDVRNLEFDLAKQGCTDYINASPNLIYTNKADHVNRISLLLITVTDTSRGLHLNTISTRIHATANEKISQENTADNTTKKISRENQAYPEGQYS
jgi:hypothetical protein